MSASRPSSPALPPAGPARTAIVTGGNRGLGLETARGIAAVWSGDGPPARIIIASRDLGTSAQAAQSLSSSLPPSSQVTITPARLDLEDPASIASFVTEQQGSRIDVLVNNAGVMGVAGDTCRTLPTIERHMVCNHLGPFLLTTRLRETGCLTRGSRVVNVASRAHYQGNQANITAPPSPAQPRWWLRRYADSKLANVVATAEMRRRWDGVAVVSVSPGLVATTLFDSLPFGMGHLLRPFLPWVARTPAQGAQTSVWASVHASDAELAEPGALFLHDCKPLAPLPAAADPAVGAALWAWSERAVAEWK